MLATLAVVAAVRSRIKQCEDVRAKESYDTQGNCVCADVFQYAMGNGCGNALWKWTFPLGAIVDVMECRMLRVRLEIVDCMY